VSDESRQQLRVLAFAAGRVVLITVGLGIFYVLIPVPGVSGPEAFVGLGLGLLLFIALLLWELRAIVHSPHPVTRAGEALAVAIPAVVIVFALTYLGLSRANAASFNEPLNHVGAVYYTVSVLSTVGFGDITARTQTARLLVSAQMLFDLGLLVLIARTVVGAARLGIRRRDAGTAAPPG